MFFLKYDNLVKLLYIVLAFIFKHHLVINTKIYLIIFRKNINLIKPRRKFKSFIFTKKNYLIKKLINKLL